MTTLNGNQVWLEGNVDNLYTIEELQRLNLIKEVELKLIAKVLICHHCKVGTMKQSGSTLDKETIYYIEYTCPLCEYEMLVGCDPNDDDRPYPRYDRRLHDKEKLSQRIEPIFNPILDLSLIKLYENGYITQIIVTCISRSFRDGRFDEWLDREKLKVDTLTARELSKVPYDTIRVMRGFGRKSRELWYQFLEEQQKIEVGE